MIKKFRKLFLLESDLQARLSKASAEVAEYFKAIDGRVNDYARMMDKMRAETDKRLSRIEVLLEDELKAKEQANIQKIKEMRHNA